MSDPNEQMFCIQCKVLIRLHYIEEIKNALMENQWCFNCWFWEEKVGWLGNPDVVRIDGRHYAIKPDPPEGTNRSLWGAGGRGFIIRFFNSREVKTHNLWYQGKIPEHFKDRLPDNAEFVK